MEAVQKERGRRKYVKVSGICENVKRFKGDPVQPGVAVSAFAVQHNLEREDIQRQEKKILKEVEKHLDLTCQA